MRWLEVLLPTLLTLAACQNGVGPRDVNKTSDRLGGAYDATLGAGAALVISKASIVAVKKLPKGEAPAGDGAAADPRRERFAAGLYPKLQGYCGQCHGGQNDFPFASPGLDLAWVTAQRYLSADPAQSKIIQNVRAGHNGVDPAWEEELAPLIGELAAP
jgi:mono/diheme cytochrome c family protein